MFIRVNVAEVWLSSFLPLEEKIANYPPLADAPQLIVVMQLVTKCPAKKQDIQIIKLYRSSSIIQFQHR